MLSVLVGLVGMYFESFLFSYMETGVSRKGKNDRRAALMLPGSGEYKSK